MVELSIIVVIYEMYRELPRTLYSLMRPYQKNIEGLSYEVIVIDNGSSKKHTHPIFLDSKDSNFYYYFLETNSPSPAAALNLGARLAKGERLLLCIDGARILSPNILALSMKAGALFQRPFAYTLGMHIGCKPQNFLVEEGYNQEVEDKILAQTGWEGDGYELFKVSSAALSCKGGFFSNFSESNAFCLLKEDYWRLDGFDERFQSKGGGLVNLDFFNRAYEYSCLEPVLLLGEATFHQFHGGVATNAPMSQHPWDMMCAEYKEIKGRDFSSAYYSPFYLGHMPDQASHLFGYRGEP